MSDIQNFDVEIRENTGTGGARAARREGLVPGVLYGGGEPAISISLQFNEVYKAYRLGRFESRLAQITHKGKAQAVIARDVQVDPIKDRPIHVDLLRVDDKTMIKVEVAVQCINEEEAPGLKRGGALNIVRHSVELLCPVTRIPDSLIADLTGMDINDSLHISAIDLPEGVTPTITDRDFTVITIAAAMAETVETDDEETPEVGLVGEEASEEGEESEDS